MTELFFPSWQLILINISSGSNISEVAEKSCITFRRAYSLIIELEKIGYITTRKIREYRVITLTESGKELKIQLEKTYTKVLLDLKELDLKEKSKTI